MAKPKQPKQKVTFTYRADGASKVQIAGDFTGWDQAPIDLEKQRGGVWKKSVSLPPGRYEYRVLVDGQWKDDPECPNRQPNQYGGQNCVCVVMQAAGPPADTASTSA